MSTQSKRSITIVGGGQAGLQLALGLQKFGHDVRVVESRTAKETYAGKVLSSQCMFGQALGFERALGINFWEAQCPPIASISFTLAPPDAPGVKAIDWNARLEHDAQSVDQRLKFSGWLQEFAARGGHVEIREAGIADLEVYARESDLVVVAAGKGQIAQMFERDAPRCVFDTPQRALALTYVHGLKPRPGHSAVAFSLIPGIGEVIIFPCLTTSGPCDIMVFEGIVGGPMDCWGDIGSPGDHLARSRQILERWLPWEAERCGDITLTDDNGILTGSVIPVVRRPIGRLPSGRIVLGMGDTVVLNDPITGQGSSNAAKCAQIYLEAILARSDGRFDESWMQATFERYWAACEHSTGWSNALLRPPPPHMVTLLGAAQQFPALARRIANAFDDPRDLFPWFAVPDEADAYLQRLGAAPEGN